MHKSGPGSRCPEPAADADAGQLATGIAAATPYVLTWGLRNTHDGQLRMVEVPWFGDSPPSPEHIFMANLS